MKECPRRTIEEVGRPRISSSDIVAGGANHDVRAGPGNRAPEELIRLGHRADQRPEEGSRRFIEDVGGTRPIRGERIADQKLPTRRRNRVYPAGERPQQVAGRPIEEIDRLLSTDQHVVAVCRHSRAESRVARAGVGELPEERARRAVEEERGVGVRRANEQVASEGGDCLAEVRDRGLRRCQTPQQRWVRFRTLGCYPLTGTCLGAGLEGGAPDDRTANGRHRSAETHRGRIAIAPEQSIGRRAGRVRVAGESDEEQQAETTCSKVHRGPLTQPGWYRGGTLAVKDKRRLRVPSLAPCQPI